jgi:hypothetical protein
MNSHASDRLHSVSANHRRTDPPIIIAVLLTLACCVSGNAPDPVSVPASARAGTDSPVKESRQHRQLADAAYRAKDYAGCVRHLTRALSLIPDHPSIRLSLARAQARLGNTSEALRLLGSLSRMKLFFAIDKIADFESIKASPEFVKLVSAFDRNRSPLVRSAKAFSVQEKGLIGEGLAYDAATKTFFVSSVHKRKILAVAPDGKVTPFAGDAERLWSVCGMRVDPKRRILWAATAATPQMEDFKKEFEGQSAVLKFDLETGKLLKNYPVPDRSKPHWLGDVTINSRGEVFATDSVSAGLYVIRPGKDEIEMVLDGKLWGSPQGMAFSNDDRHLFVADYSSGVYSVNLATKETTHLAPPSDTTLLGIDGLYFFRGNLIAVQNGVTPHRILCLVMTKSLDAIQSVDVIESNNPLFEEPTLGVIVGSTFHFIANSQWDLIDDAGRLAPIDKLQELIVLKTRLRM